MGKGSETKERILEQAVRIASRDGLQGLTIGTLSSELGLSKSGLFAHFGSKEELQCQVLQQAASRFQDEVLRPAIAAPRGEPRIRALFDRWLAWANRAEMPGGCVLIAASIELDDRPGPQRDYLLLAHRSRVAALAKAAQLAIDAGHFRQDLDPEQFAFDFYAITLGYHDHNRLLRDPKAEERARNSFERLIASCHA
jgi:AcrR family transcriptional regulator